MKGIQARTLGMPREDGSRFYGQRSLYGGRPLVPVKVLGDRRTVGGGIAYLLKLSPPSSKLIKIVVVARSEEHVCILEGGYCNNRGQRLRGPGDYGYFNPPGRA